MIRHAITWGELAAIEPTRDELVAHSHALSAAYNDPHNAALMGHAEPITAAEVVEHYVDSIARGMRAFLLLRGGELAGDADLRNIDRGAAEFAFMIGAPSAQGQGLGTRFASMVHAFGFATLGLERVYASVVPHNRASLRAFEKLGYVADDSPAARLFADEPDDVTLVLDRAAFEARHAAALAEIRIASR